jgi:saccharopepsin
MSQDTLRIGELSIMERDFAEATKETGRGPAFWKMDGVFGLGYAAAAVNLAVPPFYNMINQGLTEPVFAFYFSDAHGEDDIGEITFGGINHHHYTGDLTTLPIRHKPTWETIFTSITFGNWTAELNDTGAAIDTGASMIVLPSTLSTLMYASIPSNLYNVPNTLQQRTDGRNRPPRWTLFHRLLSTKAPTGYNLHTRRP